MEGSRAEKRGIGQQEKKTFCIFISKSKIIDSKAVSQGAGEMTFAQNDANPKTPELGDKESLIEFMHKASEE